MQNTNTMTAESYRTL